MSGDPYVEVADEVQQIARRAVKPVGQLAQDQNPYYTFHDMVSDLQDAKEGFARLIELTEKAVSLQKGSQS